MNGTKRPMRTYRVEYNGETKYENSSRDGIAFASIGVFSDGRWFITLTTQTDPVKAARAARGTNPYATQYIAVPVTEVPYTGAAHERNAAKAAN